MPPNTVKVDRTTKWGNPFVIKRDDVDPIVYHIFNKQTHTEEMMFGDDWMENAKLEIIDMFRNHVAKNVEIDSGYLDHLRGKNLACWCPLDQPCHADVLLELANMEK